jgi:thiol-disulfide isomerase/thioredoxin
MTRGIRFVILGIAMTVGCVAVNADTIHLNSGSPLTATVTKYSNNAFEIRSADGNSTSYPAANVRQIDFEQSGARAQLTTRTNGRQEGTAVSFANGSFTITTAQGNRQFPLVFVERAAFVPDRGQEVEVISHGAEVDIAKHLSAGNVTIVDFYADWCGPCRLITPVLEQMARTDPEIALRKIDIVNWTTPVAKQHGVQSIPRVSVYGRTGQLVGTVSGANAEKVRQYVAQAKAGG